MAYDEKAAARIRRLFAGRRDVVEKKMFGGLSFLVRDRMTLGLLGDDLVVRVAPEDNEEALARPHARPMDFTRRPMKGWIYVAPPGYATAAALRGWAERALTSSAKTAVKKVKRSAPR